MPRAGELRIRLVKNHRILIRNCDSYEGLAKGCFVRVAVRSAAENGRLIEALTIEAERLVAEVGVKWSERTVASTWRGASKHSAQACDDRHIGRRNAAKEEPRLRRFEDEEIDPRGSKRLPAGNWN